MRLVFRADASPEIGSGHVMRCSAIAEEAISRGIQSILVGSTGGLAWLDNRLSDIGMDLVDLEYLQESTISHEDALVIDSYDLQKTNEFISMRNGGAVISIVDSFTPIFPADLFIHPGIDGSWFSHGNTDFLSGPTYIPLRRSIQKLDIKVVSRVKKVAVFGGGTDVFGFGFAVAECLSRLEDFDEAVFFSLAESDIKSLDNRFRVVPFGASLDSELENTDLVLSTASTSSLEILAREMPLGIACAVDNQLTCYNALNALGVSVPVGVRSNNGKWELDLPAISSLIKNKQLRSNLLENTRGFIDLQGAKRILDAILNLPYCGSV